MSESRQRLQLHRIPVNGTELHYIEQGTGEAVLFVHGGMGDYRTWLPQVATFSARYRAVAYSRRASYPNPFPSGYVGAIAQHVDDMAALVQSLDLAPVHIVANSYGGYIGLLLAVARPELVRSLALAEPPVQPLLLRVEGGSELLDAVTEQAWIPSRAAFARGDDEEGVRRFLDGAVAPGTYEGLPQRTREAMMKNMPEMRAASSSPYEITMPDIPCRDLARVTAPVLLMRGERSPGMYHLINDELARCLPSAEQAPVPGAAHILHAQNPHEHNRLVLDFLSRVE